MIPLQLSQLDKSPFLCNFTISPIFQSSGMFSVSQMSLKVCVRPLGVTVSSASQLSHHQSLGPFHSSSPLWPFSPLQVLGGLCSHPHLLQLLVSELFLLAPACSRWSGSVLSSTPISMFHLRRCFHLYP